MGATEIKSSRRRYQLAWGRTTMQKKRADGRRDRMEPRWTDVDVERSRPRLRVAERRGGPATNYYRDLERRRGARLQNSRRRIFAGGGVDGKTSGASRERSANRPRKTDVSFSWRSRRRRRARSARSENAAREEDGGELGGDGEGSRRRRGEVRLEGKSWSGRN